MPEGSSIEKMDRDELLHYVAILESYLMKMTAVWGAS
jgi:hypothetical protein